MSKFLLRKTLLTSNMPIDTKTCCSNTSILRSVWILPPRIPFSNSHRFQKLQLTNADIIMFVFFSCISDLLLCNKVISNDCAYLICFLTELGWPEQGTSWIEGHSRPQSCWGTGEEPPTRTGSRGEGRGLKQEKPVQSQSCLAWGLWETPMQ